MPDTDSSIEPDNSIAGILDSAEAADAVNVLAMKLSRKELLAHEVFSSRAAVKPGLDRLRESAPLSAAQQNKVAILTKTKSTAGKKAGLNVAAAFTLFCRGMSLQEIAGEFGMTLAAMQLRARSEDWEALARDSRAIVAPPPSAALVSVNAEETQRKQKRIESNREKAFSVSETLRTKVMESLKSIDDRADAIAVELRKLFTEINALAVEQQLDVSPEKGKPVNTRLQAFVCFADTIKAWDFSRVADILALAKAAHLIDESSMTALGDVVQKGGNLGNQSATPTFVINLPGVAATPRMPKILTPILPLGVPTAVTKPRQLPTSAEVLSQKHTSISDNPAAVDIELATDEDPPVEVTIVGGTLGETEAVEADTKRGHSIDFDAL
jgi:hypothetical protein